MSLAVFDKTQVRIGKSKGYSDWDVFCSESLENAKSYVSYDTNERERILRINGVLGAIIKVIELAGFGTFTRLVDVLKLGTALTVAALLGVVVAGCNPYTILATGAVTFALGSAVYVLHSNRKLTIQVHEILEQYKTPFENTSSNNSLGRIKIDKLFEKCVFVVIEQIFNKKILFEDTSVPLNPVCLCGKILKPVSVKACYNGKWPIVICDICDKIVSKDSEVFHCSNEYTKEHTRGFDICVKCSRENNNRLKRYHALIICDKLDSQEYKQEDSKELYKLFNKLNYHSVTVLENENVTKLNIIKELKKLSFKSNNDTIIIYYLGHGWKWSGDGQFLFWLHTYEKITSQIFISHLIETPTNENNNNNRNSNNFEWILESNDVNTKDIFIVINACYSGSFEYNPKVLKTMKSKNNILFNNKMKELKMDEKELKEIKNWQQLHYEALKSVYVLCATDKNEEGIFTGGLTPFARYVIESFKSNEELSDVTTEDVSNYVVKRSKESDDTLGIWAQKANVSQKDGLFANHFSLKPAVKPYE